MSIYTKTSLKHVKRVSKEDMQVVARGLHRVKEPTNEQGDSWPRPSPPPPAWSTPHLIYVLPSRDIDCIVAPYEADSQHAYLNMPGLADIVSIEVSDLTLFGCDTILFKLQDTEGLHHHLFLEAEEPL